MKDKIGIQFCDKCKYKLRCDECVYNEKDIVELLAYERKEAIKQVADWLDNEKGYCGLGYLIKMQFDVKIDDGK